MPEECDGNAQWLRVSEVAGMLSVSRSFLYQRIEAGEIPCRRIGRTVRIPAEWVKTGKVPGGGKNELE